jgi:hypothetical protein
MLKSRPQPSLYSFSMSALAALFIAPGCGATKGDTKDDAQADLGEVPVSGTTYNGGDRIYLPDGGLSFTIPANFIGEGNATSFAVGRQELDALVALSTMEASRAAIEDEMVTAIDTDFGLFTPEGSLESDGQSAVMDYSVTLENGDNAEGSITSFFGNYGHAGIALSVATQEDFGTILQASDDLVATMALSTPQSDAGDGTGDPPSGSFEADVVGYRFTYYYTDVSSSYSEEDRYTICGDGSAGVYRNTSDLSGTIISDWYGQWDIVSSTASSATIRFSLEDGQVFDKTIVYQDGEFSIDGYRYFREDAGC